MGCTAIRRGQRMDRSSSLFPEPYRMTAQSFHEIDLPYRHYVSRYEYITSALPHRNFHFKHHYNFHLGAIAKSSIFQRRLEHTEEMKYIETIQNHLTA